MKFNIEVLEHKNRVSLTTSKKIEVYEAKKILKSKKHEFNEIIFQDGNCFIFNIVEEVPVEFKKEEIKPQSKKRTTRTVKPKPRTRSRRRANKTENSS